MDIVYSQRGLYKETTGFDKNVWKYEPLNISTLAINPSSSPLISYLFGEIRRGSDGRLYIPNMADPADHIHSYSNSTWNGDVTDTDPTAALYELASALPTQVFKIFNDPTQVVTEHKRSIRKKEYELTDHLGNVKMVISDAKLIGSTDNTIDDSDNLNPDITSYTDYYPFGSPMPSRQFNSGDYRYGMNSQEKTDEIAGSGNHTTAAFWEYDTRLGRRWNIDPVDYPWQSSYACFNNNPIYYSDPLGREGEGWVPKEGGGYKYDPDPSKGTETADWTGGNINKVPYEVHGNKDGSMEVSLHEVSVFPEKTQGPTAHQQAIYNFCDDFSKGCLIGAIAMPAAVVAAPFVAAEASLISGGASGVSLNIVSAGGTGYLGNGVLRTAIDASAQMAVNNGDIKKLDVGDALMTGFLTPGASAVFGGAVDYRPFAQKPLMTVVNGKDIYEAIYDGSMKYAFSRNGNVGGPVNQLGKEFSTVGGSNMWPIISAPYNAATKKASAELKKAIFSK